MLVLLHFYQLGYTPFTLAFLFLLYETAGIFANLGGGWLALRFGIPRMLAVGLALQIFGLLMLSALQPGLGRRCLGRLGGRRPGHCGGRQGPDQDRFEVRHQGDLRAGRRAALQMGGLVHRLEERDEGARLLRGRRAAAVRRLPPGAVADGGDARRRPRRSHVALPRTLGKAKSSKSFRELFAKTRGHQPARGGPHLHVRVARRLVRGRPAGVPVRERLAYMGVAGFLAAWTIGYGGVQALAPSVVRRSADGLSREVPAARLWGAVLTAIPIVPRAAYRLPRDRARRPGRGRRPGGVRLRLRRHLVAALLPHPGLRRIGEGGRGRRLLLRRERGGAAAGILLSGALTQAGGIQACLWGSAAMLAACLAVTILLPTAAEARRLAV